MGKFPLGEIVIMPGVAKGLSGTDALALVGFIKRHWDGDWGDIVDEDKAVNVRALTRGGQLLSSYELPNGTTIWIVTDADRARTTVLLPSEY